MKRIYLLILVSLLTLLTAVVCVCGQNDNNLISRPKYPVSSINAAAGLNNFHIKDEYLSPYIFGGSVFSSELSYKINLDRQRHECDIYFSTGNISSEKWAKELKLYTGKLSYSYFQSVKNWTNNNSQIELFLGIGVSSFAQFSVLPTSQDITWYGTSDKSWYWSHSTDIHLFSEYRFADGKTVSFQISLPFLRFISRPDYSHNFSYRNYSVSNSFFHAGDKGKAEYLWENKVINCKIKYQLPLRDYLNLQCSYSFSYLANDSTLPVAMYNNNFAAGLIWDF